MSRYFRLALLPVLSTAVLFAGCAKSPQSTSRSQAVVAAKRRALEASNINVNLGLAYLRKKQVVIAKQKLTKAIKDAPRNPAGWYAMGYLMENTGNENKAEAYYAKAVKVAPKSGPAQNNYGTFLCRRGRYRQAIRHFLRAVEEPHYLDIAGAYENAGLCSMLIPDDNAAIAYFKKAISNGPNRTTSMYELAKLYQKKGDFRQAKMYLKMYERSNKPTPESREIGRQLAQRKTIRSAVPNPKTAGSRRKRHA